MKNIYKKDKINDTERRKKGQFYTPTLFVDYAHKMISEQFGDDWKEKYVVWDNCSGTKNLTRDYYFKELYCSTLENAELQISEQYNREATSFQFDFLNDSLDKLPQGLKDALEQNKPIIFFINPPYARNTGSNNGIGTSESVCETMVNQQMKNNKIGACSANLYAQFLYRIVMIKEQYSLTNVHIALFCPSNFLTGQSFKKLRKKFLSNFSYVDGVLFKASHFADVADNWGISFSVWNCGETVDKNNFNYKLVDNIDGEIKIIGEKTVYNLDNENSARDWAKEPIKNEKLYNTIPLKSALNVGNTNGTKLTENYLGCYVNGGNNINHNTQSCFIINGSCNTVTAPSFSIDKLNFDRVIASFASRRVINANWINWADEYLAPNEVDERYSEFVNDSIVYSLFHSASNQSSLRQIEYKGKNWDIKNEFFFMSKNGIMALASDNGFDFTFNDAMVSNERYVYSKLQGIELSAEARAVLDKAIELTKESFKYRALFDEEHPEYQIMNWDCGWYQIKAILKEYMPNEYKEFTELFKKLADKMRPMVYELGFLKQ